MRHAFHKIWLIVSKNQVLDVLYCHGNDTMMLHMSKGLLATLKMQFALTATTICHVTMINENGEKQN